MCRDALERPINPLARRRSARDGLGYGVGLWNWPNIASALYDLGHAGPVGTEAFAKAVLDGIPPPVTAETGARTRAVLDAARHSETDGRSITLRQPGRAP